MGRVGKGVKCSVKGCENRAVRSISVVEFEKAWKELEIEQTASRVYLCERHYKEYKKRARKLRKIEKWRWMKQ
ncbi:MAG: hypothetical protein J7J67_00350 [Thermoproteales archaeon]|nr:hypothetical protein [Thermoproteales archaeon]